MAKQSKTIHLIKQYGYRCKATCAYYSVVPIESTIIDEYYDMRGYNKGTFNPTKVTCKRCLKHSDYKEALDRVKYPLFFLKENR